jgi:putative heme-binding domain-containing protein
MTTFTEPAGAKTIYRHAAHARVLAAMAESSRVRNLRPSGDLTQAVRRLLDQSDETVRVVALRLAAQWKLTGLQPEVLRLAQAAANLAPDRLAAIEALPGLGGDGSGMALKSLAESSQPAAVRVAAISSFAVLEPTQAAALAADALAEHGGDSLAAPLTSAFLKRRDGARALTIALTARPPRRDAARLALRQMQAVGREDKALVDVLSRAAMLGGEPLRATPDVLSTLVNEVRDSGNVAHGAEVFRRADVNCASCHAVSGQGGSIGPSLDSIGAGQPLDFIIGAVLEPNKEVKESFEAIEVTTKDGETYQGYRIRSDTNELVLRDVISNQEVRLRRDQIADQQNRGSVMPTGLVDHLTREELRDLFRYLSELGRTKP